MAPTFGTSGLRGLVTDLTDDVIARYTLAFLHACPHGGRLFVGRDLRPSSPTIAGVVIEAAREAGVDVVDCGVLPTPALAQASLSAGAAAVMVTGSHIPADRNGLKFYVPTGEITKDDEAAISHAYSGGSAPQGEARGSLSQKDAIADYADRMVSALGQGALSGQRIGVYRHSSVARDVLESVLSRLGAETVPLGHSDTFIPVDTEAVDPETRDCLAGWASDHGLHAIVSTDGDGDRPMVADNAGRIVPGDVLGVLTAQVLGARIVVTPVSSNDMITHLPLDAVHLTRIGSPFVIAEMERVLAANPDARVVGFEANGGFLLGFTATLSGPLSPLMTRDCLLPIVAPLARMATEGKSLSDLIATLPSRYTAADRIQDIDTTRSAEFLRQLDTDPEVRSEFFDSTGAVEDVDRTDGLRVILAGGDTVHLRPSGNAPEFRIYAQANSQDRANDLVATYRDRVAAMVR